LWLWHSHFGLLNENNDLNVFFIIIFLLLISYKVLGLMWHWWSLGMNMFDINCSLMEMSTLVNVCANDSWTPRGKMNLLCHLAKKLDEECWTCIWSVIILFSHYWQSFLAMGGKYHFRYLNGVYVVSQHDSKQWK